MKFGTLTPSVNADSQIPFVTLLFDLAISIPDPIPTTSANTNVTAPSFNVGIIV